MAAGMNIPYLPQDQNRSRRNPDSGIDSGTDLDSGCSIVVVDLSGLGHSLDWRCRSDCNQAGHMPTLP